MTDRCPSCDTTNFDFHDPLCAYGLRKPESTNDVGVAMNPLLESALRAGIKAYDAALDDGYNAKSAMKISCDAMDDFAKGVDKGVGDGGPYNENMSEDDARFNPAYPAYNEANDCADTTAATLIAQPEITTLRAINIPAKESCPAIQRWFLTDNDMRGYLAGQRGAYAHEDGTIKDSMGDTVGLWYFANFSASICLTNVSLK